MNSEEKLHLSIQIIKEIADNIEDCVFVGGVSEYFQGLKQSFSDIDLCILQKDITLLIDVLGYLAPNPQQLHFNSDCLQRFMFRAYDVIVDVYVLEALPEHLVKDGVRIDTIESAIQSKQHALQIDKFKDNGLKEKKYKIN